MMQRREKYGILLLSLFTLPVPAAAAANKCMEHSGRIFYQAAPCPVNTQGGDMSLNVNRTRTGPAQRPPTPATAPVTAEQATLPGQATDPTPATSPSDPEQ